MWTTPRTRFAIPNECHRQRCLPRLTSRRRQRPPIACRRGIAVKELLLVLAAISSGVAAIKFIDPISDAERVPFVGQLEQMMQCEVPLSDGFACVVTVDRISSPDPEKPPLYSSRLQIADRVPAGDGAFLFEVLITETVHWRDTSQCKAWSFVSAQTALDRFKHRSDATGDPSAMSPQQQLALDLQTGSNGVQTTFHLADPLMRSVPPELQESGILAVTDDATLDYLQELDGFPLGRLCSALGKAAQNDGWPRDAPQSLFPPKGTTALTADQELKLAQALLARLIADLPVVSSP